MRFWKCLLYILQSQWHPIPHSSYSTCNETESYIIFPHIYKGAVIIKVDSLSQSIAIVWRATWPQFILVARPTVMAMVDITTGVVWVKVYWPIYYVIKDNRCQHLNYEETTIIAQFSHKGRYEMIRAQFISMIADGIIYIYIYIYIYTYMYVKVTVLSGNCAWETAFILRLTNGRKKLNCFSDRKCLNPRGNLKSPTLGFMPNALFTRNKEIRRLFRYDYNCVCIMNNPASV